MTTNPDAESQIQALARVWVQEYRDWFCIHDKKWWRRHGIVGSWSTLGARDLAEQRVGEAVVKLDMGVYQWIWERARQPYTVKRVLEKVAPRIAVLEIPGPPVDVDPHVLEAFYRSTVARGVEAILGTRSTEE